MNLLFLYISDYIIKNTSCKCYEQVYVAFFARRAKRLSFLEIIAHSLQYFCNLLVSSPRSVLHFAQAFAICLSTNL